MFGPMTPKAQCQAVGKVEAKLWKILVGLEVMGVQFHARRATLLAR
jgi:hypothetical protein